MSLFEICVHAFLDHFGVFILGCTPLIGMYSLGIRYATVVFEFEFINYGNQIQCLLQGNSRTSTKCSTFKNR